MTTTLPRITALLLVLLLTAAGTARAQEAWQPKEAPLMTRWADRVSPETVQERPYPRPQMRRDRWQSLNGLWDYAIAAREDDRPQRYDGEILVPFAIESALSGVMERVESEQHLWYRRTFEVPDAWDGQRVLLHFGAVDWEAAVFVNGEEVGTHRGGYDPFAFDVTDALRDGGEQELVVRVYDPTDAAPHPRGKQVSTSGGIWYTPVTGIWQTVWLEPVPQARIDDLEMAPDLDAGVLRLTVNGQGAGGASVEAVARDVDGAVVGRAEGAVGEALALAVPAAHLWTPDDPYLYDLTVRLKQGSGIVDEVDSYFGMREVEIGPGPDGKTRILLNGEFVFQYGPLDQGYWPDGLYTAPTDEALAYDLEVTKDLGYNMVRKHVKVEPRRWYYLTDSLGLLVWQDMPSGVAGRRQDRPHPQRTGADEEQFEQELAELIDDFYNFPSIVMWVVFNEGWGQYDTERITQWVEQRDPTRIINSVSGWTDRGVGDTRDVHVYPGPGAPPAEEDRAIILGEFGGLGLPIAAHTWQDEANWGYRSYEDPAALTGAYVELVDQLRLLVDEPGLSGAVYTQTTDVEIEVNGLLTYDRDVLKMNSYRITQANQRLYETPPEVVVILPTAEQEPATWRYTAETPLEGWTERGFDASGWQQGTSGFGTEETPGAVVGTEWTTDDLWLRRTFTYDGGELERPYLHIHHDDDAEVYLNGQKIAELDRWTRRYSFVRLDERAQDALRRGENTLAIHVHQRGGDQYIDAGLVDVVERETR